MTTTQETALITGAAKVLAAGSPNNWRAKATAS